MNKSVEEQLKEKRFLANYECQKVILFTDALQICNVAIAEKEKELGSEISELLKVNDFLKNQNQDLNNFSCDKEKEITKLKRDARKTLKALSRIDNPLIAEILQSKGL